jgi:hypothetical protein
VYKYTLCIAQISDFKISSILVTIQDRNPKQANIRGGTAVRDRARAKGHSPMKPRMTTIGSAPQGRT